MPGIESARQEKDKCAQSDDQSRPCASSLARGRGFGGGLLHLVLMILLAFRHSEHPLCEPWLDRFVLLKYRRVWKWPVVPLRRDAYERSTRALSLTFRSRGRWLLRMALLGLRRTSAQSNVGVRPLVGIEYRSSGSGGNEGSAATTCRSASDRKLPTAPQGSSQSLLAGGERTGVGPRDVMIRQAPEKKERDLDDGDRTAVAVLM